MIIIRPAKPQDANAAVNVLRRSITELCSSDHRDDAASLAQWLANKTTQNFLAWLADNNNFCFVAEGCDRLLGMGMLGRTGKIHLLYLLPGAQRRGIGKAIYLAMEQQAKTWGLQKLSTESTTTACAFYERMGFTRAGAAVPGFGVALSQPYEKAL
jgi:GNAT superfamily N-acetyltransferase